MGRINIELPENAHRIAKSVCALEGTTLIEFINQAIKEKLEQEEDKN